MITRDTRIRPVTRGAFGFDLPDVLIALAMPSLSGRKSMHSGRI